MLITCPNHTSVSPLTGRCSVLQGMGLHGNVSALECQRCGGLIDEPPFLKIIDQQIIESRPQLKTADDLPCIYRGEKLRDVECQGCEKKLQPVYKCWFLGSCSLRTIMHRDAPKARCLGCELREPPPKLTASIVMASCHNYSEVALTIAALRATHEPSLFSEIIIADNGGDDWQTKALEDLANRVPRCKYVPAYEVPGPCHAKQQAILAATSDVVICMDSHIVIDAGGILDILKFFEERPSFHGLCVGPMKYDSGSFETEFRVFRKDGAENWSDGMLGQWMRRADCEVDSEPFPIITNGMGLFACRRDDWVGFDMACRGFGGEEFYLSEAFRQRFGETDGATMCIPSARWWHRFRQEGEGSTATWESKLRNNLLHFRLLGRDDSQLMEHFRQALGERADEIRSHLFQPQFHS